MPKPGCAFKSEKNSRDPRANLVMGLLFRTLRFPNRGRDAKTAQPSQQLLIKETAGIMKHPQRFVEAFVSR